jgi:hypothetical protein
MKKVDINQKMFGKTLLMWNENTKIRRVDIEDLSKEHNLKEQKWKLITYHKQLGIKLLNFDI